jgi:hypothetical protein
MGSWFLADYVKQIEIEEMIPQMTPNSVVLTDGTGKLAKTSDISVSKIQKIQHLPSNKLLGTNVVGDVVGLDTIDLATLPSKLLPTENALTGYYLDGNNGTPRWKQLDIGLPPNINMEWLQNEFATKQNTITPTTNITAATFSGAHVGNGAGLTNIPSSSVDGLAASITSLQSSIDQKQPLITGSTAIIAQSFEGNGSNIGGLTIPQIQGLNAALDSKQNVISGTTDLTVKSLIANDRVTVLSDGRLKSDIEIIQDPLYKIQQLKGCEYTINNHRSAGLIAQDIQLVMPTAVCESEEGRLSVDYNQIIALLVETCKKLSHEIELLKAQKK